MAGLNQVKESKSSLAPDNWIFNDNTDVNKQLKTCKDSLQLEKITHYHKNE
jgi:hypothetical protein